MTTSMLTSPIGVHELSWIPRNVYHLICTTSWVLHAHYDSHTIRKKRIYFPFPSIKELKYCKHNKNHKKMYQGILKHPMNWIDVPSYILLSLMQSFLLLRLYRFIIIHIFQEKFLRLILNQILENVLQCAKVSKVY